MELIVDDMHPGTDERTWLGSRQLRELPPLRSDAGPAALVIVAPHPDDEVLGAGGLLQTWYPCRCRNAVIAVTDGEASHPGAGAQGYDLPAMRAAEAQVALERLGCGATRIQRLGLPDGAVAISSRTSRTPSVACSDLTTSASPRGDRTVTQITRPPATATMAAARTTCTSVLEYLVWTWHWATPESGLIPWSQCRRLALGRRQMARKRWATYAYASQIRPFGDVQSRFWPTLC